LSIEKGRLKEKEKEKIDHEIHDEIDTVQGQGGGRAASVLSVSGFPFSEFIENT
jgi:hypothetical protein